MGTFKKFVATEPGEKETSDNNTSDTRVRRCRKNHFTVCPGNETNRAAGKSVV